MTGDARITSAACFARGRTALRTSDGKACLLARIERAGRDEVTFEGRADSQQGTCRSSDVLLSIVEIRFVRMGAGKATELGVHSIVRSPPRGVKRRSSSAEKALGALEENPLKLRRVAPAYLFRSEWRGESPAPAFARASVAKLMFSERVARDPCEKFCRLAERLNKRSPSARKVDGLTKSSPRQRPPVITKPCFAAPDSSVPRLG